MRNGHNILVGEPEGKRSLGRLSVDGTIILKWILREIALGVWLSIGTGGGNL
jgi:hypothetical protein